MLFPRRIFLLVVAVVLSVVPMFGATVTYTPGTTDTSSYSTSPPNDPLTLLISSGSATQSGDLTGTGGIIKAGAGTLTLTGSNSYEGGTILNEGTLRLGMFDLLGSGTVTINGGALGNAATDDFAVVENSVVAAADFAIDVSGTAGAVEFFGSVDLGVAATRTITLTADGLACFGGIISGQGLTFLAGNGPTQVMFCDNVSNVFTGPLRVGSNVTLELEKVGEGVIAVAGDMTVDAGGTVELWNTEQFATTSNVEINGSLRGMSAGQNTINALSGTGSIIGENGDTLAVNSGTFSGSITEQQVIVKQGPGTLVLTGSSSYTGGTIVNSGTLRAGNTKALGNGNVAVNDGAVLWVDSGIALDLGTGNKITLENDGASTYRKDFALNEDYTNFGAITSSGSNATVAQILSGTASAAGSVEASFDDAPTTPASNDALRISDVLTLDGLSGETFVLQMSYPDAASFQAQLYIAYLDGGVWVPVGTGSVINAGWSGEMEVGTYGVDTLNHVVWVVTDHNSEFAVVPEPGTIGLLACGALAWIARRRRTA